MPLSKLEIISNSMLFNGLGSEEIGRIGEIAVYKELEKGDHAFFEGDNCSGFYIVAEGFIKVYKVSGDGKEQILHIFGPGEPFGEVPVFSGKNFPASAEAITWVSLLFFPRSSFVELITKNPALSLNMMAVLAARLRKFTAQIEDLSLKEVPARLAGYLVYLAGDRQDINEVSLDISKGQLASFLGTVPETLSRVFARMKKAGLIHVDDRKIRILDLERLEALARSGKYDLG